MHTDHDEDSNVEKINTSSHNILNEENNDKDNNNLAIAVENETSQREADDINYDNPFKLIDLSDDGPTSSNDEHNRKRVANHEFSIHDLYPAKKKFHRKLAWSRDEDNLLLESINKYGAANWDILAKHLVNRTGKQCRERYFNILDPQVKRGHWSVEEDHLIIELHNTIGNKWAEISKYLGGRTDNSVKNRWHTLNNSCIIPQRRSESSGLSIVAAAAAVMSSENSSSRPPAPLLPDESTAASDSATAPTSSSSSSQAQELPLTTSAQSTEGASAPIVEPLSSPSGRRTRRGPNFPPI